MTPKKLHVGLAAMSAFLAATAAFADFAPKTFEVNEVQEDAVLRNLPLMAPPAPPKRDPKSKTPPPPPPMDYRYDIRGGGQIPMSQALDFDSIKSSSDSRLAKGNVTCTAKLKVSTLPNMVSLGEDFRPKVEPKIFRFVKSDSEGKIISQSSIMVQRVNFPFTTKNSAKQDVDNNIECYKVGDSPFTIADLKVALGQKFEIDLSHEQSTHVEIFSEDRSIIAHIQLPPKSKPEFEDSEAENNKVVPDPTPGATAPAKITESVTSEDAEVPKAPKAKRGAH